MVIYVLQFVGLLLINNGNCIDIQRHSYLFDNSPPENGISDFIFSKGYLPNEEDLPKSSVIRKEGAPSEAATGSPRRIDLDAPSLDNDVTYLLSKLSDDELIRLLNEKPNKNVFDLNDVVQTVFGHKSNKDIKTHDEDLHDQKYKILQDTTGLDHPQTAFFKLDHRPISPENQNNKANYLALNKLNDLFWTRPQLQDENLNDHNREMLFDILIAQLRALCCKTTSKNLPQSLKALANLGNVKIPKEPHLKDKKLNEFMFLIINDEINNKNTDDDLILVNPDTLEKNSSVLLLGPITSPLTDGQLKVVMKRISNELSKPEYASLLKQLSDGKVSDSNINLMKNFVFGPESRRYIKAHRCNHQSKLSKIYGGPKWLICTGYLNINTPSLYD